MQGNKMTVSELNKSQIERLEYFVLGDIEAADSIGNGQVYNADNEVIGYLLSDSDIQEKEELDEEYLNEATGQYEFEGEPLWSIDIYAGSDKEVYFAPIKR